MQRSKDKHLFFLVLSQPCLIQEINSVMARRIVILCLVFLLSTSAEERYPEESDNDDDPSRWPGHLEYIGNRVPEKKIEMLKRFPSVNDFLYDYVIPSRTVVFKGAASNLTTLPSFDDDFLISLPYSYTTFVEARSKTDNEKRINITVRQFLKKYKSNGLYLDMSIPMPIKSRISVPRCLRCESLLKELNRTNLLYRSGEWHDPLRSREENTLLCQVEGKTEYRLIDSAIIGDRTSILDVNDGTQSSVEVQKVDFSKYPSLGKISHYYKVTLNRMDCLFIPSKWLYQTGADGRSVTLSIIWNRKLIVPSKKTCSNPEENNLSHFEFPEDHDKSNLLSLLLLGNLHSFIENFFPQSNVRLSYEEFEEKLKKDDHLTDLLEWSDKCTEKAKELFQQVDRNQDGILSPEDLDDLSSEDLQYLSGVLNDRWQDFKNIVTDQKGDMNDKDFFLDLKQSLQREVEKEIQDIFEQGFSEILQEAAASGSLPSDSGEPISTESGRNGNYKKVKIEEQNEETIEEDNEDEEMKKLKELQRKINEAKRTKSLNVNEEINKIHKDEL